MINLLLEPEACGGGKIMQPLTSKGFILWEPGVDSVISCQSTLKRADLHEK